MNCTTHAATRFLLPLVAAIALALAPAAHAQQHHPNASAPTGNNRDAANPIHASNHGNRGRLGNEGKGKRRLPAHNAHPGASGHPASTPAEGHRFPNQRPHLVGATDSAHKGGSKRPPGFDNRVANDGGRQRQTRTGAGAGQSPRHAQPPANMAAHPVYAKAGLEGHAHSQLGGRSSLTHNGSLATQNAPSHAGAHGPQTGAPSFTAPNGRKTTLGGATTVTEAGGKKVTLGGASMVKGANGESYENGVTHQSQRNSNGVNAQGDFQGGVNLNNGGPAGESESASEFVNAHNPFHDSDEKSTTTSDNGTLTWTGNNKTSGTDSDGLTWKNGKPWNGPDGNGGFYTNGHQVKGTNNSEGGAGDDPDIGSGRQGGSLYSGTGKRADPSHHHGQDDGNGPGAAGAPTGGGGNRNNANGAYVATHLNGQDATVKPKETGPMKTSYNGRKGVTDPKQTTDAGGG